MCRVIKGLAVPMFIMRISSGGVKAAAFGQKMYKNWIEAAALGQKMDK